MGRVTHRFGGWRRIEGRVRSAWDDEAVDRYWAAAGPVMLADRPRTDITTFFSERDELREAIVDDADRVRDRRFSIFGAPIPADSSLPWNADWRYDKRWPHKFFRDYDWYEPRSQPYDVKFPWELSRLWFVIPTLEAWLVTGASEWLDEAHRLVSDWENENPMGSTPNWHPMEVSMRIINLALMLDMAIVGREVPRRFIRLLLRLICGHGEFLSRNIEFSQVRGNHYMANLVALLVAGATLRGTHPPARRWFRRASSVLPNEVDRQFCRDGVNFEKSIAYHRLVAELATVALVVGERGGHRWTTRMVSRIRAAHHYAARCTRPDGRFPNVGDNDSARVLEFGLDTDRTFRAITTLGAIRFGDPGLRAGGADFRTVFWWMGREAVEHCERMEPAGADGVAHFENGGVVAARRADSFLWVDIGEVGLSGRGGHGHNDVGSFELVMSGAPLVVDPGCPTYSGDLERRDRYRSTAYHNCVVVDGEEQAPLAGVWQIGDDARPTVTLVEGTDERLEVTVSHRGYARLSDPVVLTRHLTWEGGTPRLECRDHIECGARHEVQQILHLGPEVSAEAHEGAVTLCRGRESFRLSYAQGSEVGIRPGMISEEYGHEDTGVVVVLRQTIQGDAELWFSVTREGA